MERIYGGMVDRALRSFARRIDPSDAGAHNNLGVLYFQKGLVDDAVREFNAAKGKKGGAKAKPKKSTPPKRQRRPKRPSRCA